MSGSRDTTATPAGERRHVTVLFSDLSGYTAMCEELDPEDVRDVIGQVFDAAGDVIDAYGGRIDRLLGDAVMAVFGDPTSHEDDAERAVRAALDLHAAVEAMSPELAKRTGRPLRMHTGINTGVVITGGRVSDGASGPLGDTVNLAARLDGLAGPGEILLGPSTADLVRGVFDLDDAGSHVVKGRTDPIKVARVVAVAPIRLSPSRRHGDFVGRQEELGALLGAIEQMRDGTPGAITVVADAGAGKTRLLAEVMSRCGEDVQWLEGRAYAFGDRIPYAPVIDLISRVAGVDEGDSPKKVARRLEEGISALLPDGEDVLGPLLRLYAIESPDEAAIDREAFHARLADATVRIVEALAKRAPTVVVIQDLHWADPPTVSLLREVIARLDAPVLSIFNTRPGFQLAAGERVVELRELSSRQTRQLIASLLDTDEPPRELLDVVEARADGNPFFVEEIVNSLIESGAVSHVGDTWRVTPALDAAAVPSTVRGVIAARIDRLDATRRRVLQEAAVVGREFLYKVVNRVSGSGTDLAPSLLALERADLIREKASDPDLEYLFKHALTQEVAYDGLLKRDKQVLHERVARAIESELGQRAGELTETLAHHWLRAGATDEAVHYLRLAGNKAVDRYALDEADRFYRDAYELLSDSGGDAARERALAETLIDWMLVHYYRGDLEGARQLLERHEPVFARVGDAHLSGMALAWRGTALWISGRVGEGLDLLDQALDVGDRSDCPVVVGHAIAWKMWALFLSARPQEAIALEQRLHAVIPRLEDDRYVVIKSQSAVGLCHASVGEANRSRVIAGALLELSERTGSTRAAALGHCVLAACAVAGGDFTVAVGHGRRAVDAATDPIYIATVTATLQICLAAAEEVTALREVVEESREVMSSVLAVMHRTAEAVCLMLEGRPARGMRMLAECRATARNADMDWVSAVIDLYIGMMYARIATREVSASVAVILRNPGFARQHALPARRRAHKALAKFEEEFVSGGRIYGLTFVLDFEWAKLLIHERAFADAAGHLQRALDVTADYGDSEGRRQATELLATVEEGLTARR